MDLHYAIDQHPFGGLSGWTDRVAAMRTKKSLERFERKLKQCLESRPTAATPGGAPAL